MSLELTENKSSIGSGALNDLVFILYCRVIGQWLPTRRRSVGNQSAISWGAIITIKTFLKEKIAFSFEFSLLEQETVFKIISKINSKHSCGHDDISTILMKNICPLILSPITLILNQSLSTGIFPDRLKIAKIIPLFKKEDPHKLDNYRQISLLPAFSKIFEKAVFIQLYEYFNKNNLLYKSQYGFRTFNRISIFRNYWYHR